MQNNLELENKIAEKIKIAFQTAEVQVQRKQRIKVNLNEDLVHPFLTFAKNTLSYKHLSHISCVDWIEDNQFELVYILLSYDSLVQIIAKTRINREKAEFPTARNYWPQVETYEREIHELYGINFVGNDHLVDFVLEDWEDLPPMRRDFDTVKYSQEHFFNRPGREDAQDVRKTVTKHSGEELPDLAKIYSVRN